MAQVINTNSLSLITQNNINRDQSTLSTSIERLSSGLCISNAKDDTAGQAIASRFTSNIKGLAQAVCNANDGISLAQTTEGALSETSDNLRRIHELTVQASTGTNSDSDLSSIQDEIKFRLDEIDRVSGQTQFNGVNVLSKDDSMKIQIGANDNQTISIGSQQIDSTALSLKGFTVSGVTDFSVTKLTAADDTAVAIADVKDVGGKQVNLLPYTDTASSSTKYVVADSVTGRYMEVTVVITGTTAAVTVGAAEVARAAIADPLKALDAAIVKVGRFRSSPGAVQNRLDSAVTDLNNTTTNLFGVQSHIQDTDYATEVSNMSKAQIIQQTGNSVLFKANQVPQQVLSLL